MNTEATASVSPPRLDFVPGVSHKKLTDPNAIVRADWCYNYDVGFATGLAEPVDWRVQPEWVGQRARDCVAAWEFFMVPIQADAAH